MKYYVNAKEGKNIKEAKHLFTWILFIEIKHDMVKILITLTFHSFSSQ
jgi:hypothetical protein